MHEWRRLNERERCIAPQRYSYCMLECCRSHGLTHREWEGRCGPDFCVKCDSSVSFNQDPSIKTSQPASSLRESHIQVCDLGRGPQLMLLFFVFYSNILFIDLDQFSIIYRVLHLHSSPRKPIYSIQFVIRAQKLESMVLYKNKTVP